MVACTLGAVKRELLSLTSRLRLARIQAGEATRAAAVILYACPGSASPSNLEDDLPEGLQALEASALTGLMQDAKRVVETHRPGGRAG